MENTNLAYEKRWCYTVVKRGKGVLLMKKSLWKGVAIFVAILAAVLYYYVTIPAFNLHAKGTWFFLIFFFVMIWGVIAIVKKRRYEPVLDSKLFKGFGIFIGVVLVVFFIGSLLSSQIVNAKKYQQLLKVEEGNFVEDIEELSYDQIPILDRDSATILGNRKMGSMVDMVSQFEVDEIYSQINYQDKPVRVSPLRYASAIKWLTNHGDGIPAYIMIDMATQTTSLVKLEEGIKYSTCEHFNRNIYRHLRFRYPTYIFGELSFEIDEEGTPYWICPVKKYNIGLFGGETIGKAVLCNAVTGETTEYEVGNIPEWVDRVFAADLLIELYDYYGSLKHGYWNSVLSQKDCLMTTDGYNYLAINDDVWVYTGVTSVSGDQSNVGFVLMNQRTMETKYYRIEGATESSAMASAEGQVQNLKYVATFPLLLNLGGEPTYFIALKDNAGLVKKYAMVNVEKYQVVAIGDTVSDCEKQYQALLKKEGITKEEEDTREVLAITGTIKKIAQGVVSGDSHYYVLLQESEEIFDIPVLDFVDVIRYEEGDSITIEYKKGEKTNTVLSVTSASEAKNAPKE